MHKMAVFNLHPYNLLALGHLTYDVTDHNYSLQRGSKLATVSLEQVNLFLCAFKSNFIVSVIILNLIRNISF